MSFLDKTTRSVMKKISAVVSNNYPETVGGFFIVNTSRVFNWVWPIVKVFIPEETLKKINVVQKVREKGDVRENHVIDSDRLHVSCRDTYSC